MTAVKSLNTPAVYSRIGPVGTGGKGMSENEENGESQVNAQEGLEFFEALDGFFTKDPRSMIWTLHVVVAETAEALKRIDGIPAEAHELMGRINIVQELFWETDRHNVVLDTIVGPDARQGLMRSIALLAKAYVMTKRDAGVDASALIDYLDSAARILYEVLKAVMDYAESNPCQGQDS